MSKEIGCTLIGIPALEPVLECLETDNYLLIVNALEYLIFVRPFINHRIMKDSIFPIVLKLFGKENPNISLFAANTLNVLGWKPENASQESIFRNAINVSNMLNRTEVVHGKDRHLKGENRYISSKDDSRGSGPQSVGFHYMLDMYHKLVCNDLSKRQEAAKYFLQYKEPFINEGYGGLSKYGLEVLISLLDDDDERVVEATKTAIIMTYGKGYPKVLLNSMRKCTEKTRHNLVSVLVRLIAIEPRLLDDIREGAKDIGFIIEANIPHNLQGIELRRIVLALREEPSGLRKEPLPKFAEGVAWQVEKERGWWG